MEHVDELRHYTFGYRRPTWVKQQPQKQRCPCMRQGHHQAHELRFGTYLVPAPASSCFSSVTVFERRVIFCRAVAVPVPIPVPPIPGA